MLISLLFLIGIHSATDTAHAGPLSKLASCMVALIEPHYLKLVDYPDNRILLLSNKSKEGGMIGIALKDKLGAGFFGSVVRLEFVSDPEIDRQIRTYKGVEFSRGIVAKFPHSLKYVGFGRALPFTHSENVHEVEGYNEGENALPEIEKSESYPKDAAWNKGRMPVVPITHTINTERGLVIFKPELEGKGLKQIAKEFAANGEQLPEKYERGLRDMYDFVQAVYGGAKGRTTDIRPPNLMWVEDPALLEFLGYTRPGFVLFELSKVAGNVPQYINGKGLSFDAYREEYISYLKRKLAEK